MSPVPRSHHSGCPGTTVTAARLLGRAEMRNAALNWSLQAGCTLQKMAGVNHAGLAKLNPLKAPVLSSPVVKSGSCRLYFLIQIAAELLFSTKQSHQKPEGFQYKALQHLSSFKIRVYVCTYAHTHT